MSFAELHDEPLGGAGPRLAARLAEALETASILKGEAEDVVEEALLVLTAPRLGLDASDRWRAGDTLLRSRLVQRQHQRQVLWAVDRTLLGLLSDSEAPPQERTALQRALESLTAGLAPRCRSLLRLRYGLQVASDDTLVKLGLRRTRVRRFTERCLGGLARPLLEGTLEELRTASSL